MGIISNGTTILDNGAFSASLGSLVLIKSQTASSSSSIEFKHGTSGVVFDNTYKIYKFEFISLNVSTDNSSFTFQASTNTGTSYGVAATGTYFRGQMDESGSGNSLTYITADDVAQSTGFIPISEDCGNDSDQCVSGSLLIYDPSNTTFVKHYMNHMSGAQFNNFSFNEYMAGYFNTTSAIDAIKFEFGAGNFDGTIKLYGIKDS